MPNLKPLAAVIGVGPGNGAAFVRRFAGAGYRVAMIARSEAEMARLAAEIPDVHAHGCDVADEAALTAALQLIKQQHGDIDTVVYNAGTGVWGTAMDVTPSDFERSWRINTFGAFVTARAVLPGMVAAKRGTIIFVGATASRRGGARAAAFAPAKAAQRILAESLARAYGPAGVHVAVIIIDGIVDEPRGRARFADKPDGFFVKPDDVADIALTLTRQKPSAWSFEVEARPFGETW